MWSIENIKSELSSCSYNGYIKSGLPKGLGEFLVGKVIFYMTHDLSVFKGGKNTKRYLKVISVEFYGDYIRSSPVWIVKLQSCSKNGIVNKKIPMKDFALEFILENIVAGKISIFESKKDGKFQIKVDERLTKLRMKLNGQKSHYNSVKRDLEETEKKIKDLEEQIKNFEK